MIFAYDRIINGKPVPNGYPRNFKYIESVDEYTNYFKKEPTVHEMFEYSTPIIESDKVDTDFIYPIHQYGAVEKLIGRDEKYAEFCFFHHIKPKTLDKIRKKQGIISILAFEESRVDFRTFTYLHELCNKFEVPTDVVNYITGHNYTEIKKYKRWCSLKKEKPILIVNSFSQMYMKGGDLDKLTTAFSRDQEDKIYVQHRLLSNAKEIWEWLENGAYFYVCGDKQYMAKDVHSALIEIAQNEGKLKKKDAENYINQTLMKDEHRYLRDVY